jgi:hypothetical protein
VTATANENRLRDASRAVQFARETDHTVKSTETGLGARGTNDGYPDTENSENRLRDASRTANTADYGDYADDDWDFGEIEGVRLLSRGFARDGSRVFQLAVGSGRSRIWIGNRIHINGDDDDRYTDTVARAERESDTQRRQRETARSARAALGYDAI